MLETKGLSVGYNGKIVLDGAEITAKGGEIVCLIGANGAGKTTLLRTLSSHLKAIGGAVYIDGKDLNTIPPIEKARNTAVLFTERVSAELITCLEVAETGRYPYIGRLGILSDEDRAEVKAALELVGAAELAQRRFCEISDGQRQKIMLARAIAQSPQILILDEPTSFLDIKSRLELFSIIRKLADSGISVIISMHEIEYAGRLADRLICIKNGRIDRTGTPEEIFSGGYISELYSLEKDTVDENSGTSELERCTDEPKVFIVGGNGTAAQLMRRFQREGISFAIGVLHENDIDYPVARRLASVLISEEPFCEITDEHLEQAMEVAKKCEKIICTVTEFGKMNEKNRRICELSET